MYDLSKLTANWNANGYRLPTEAEWEYAAKGGANGNYTKYSGSDNINEVAWCDLNSWHHTHEVGTKQPNELGIYDMSGNVGEICWDRYSSNYYNISPQDNPKGPDIATNVRVVRSGDYASPPRSVRVARRLGMGESQTFHFYGFRLLRTR